MTTEDFRADLDQEREYEKALVRQELEEMERAAERQERIEAARDTVLERVDHLMRVEGGGYTLYDPIWMDAMGILRDAHRRLVDLEREGL